MNPNGHIDIFRRGIVTAVNDGTGIIQQLTPWDAQEAVGTRFNFADARFVDVDGFRHDLSFGQRNLAQGDIISTLREPVVGDIVMYTDRSADGVLCATNWTFEAVYKKAEDKLPRCTAKGGCNKAPRLRKDTCTDHAHLEDDATAYDEDEVTGTEVYNRAHRVFGDSEQAHEAASLYPGDLIH